MKLNFEFTYAYYNESYRRFSKEIRELYWSNAGRLDKRKTDTRHTVSDEKDVKSNVPLPLYKLS